MAGAVKAAWGRPAVEDTSFEDIMSEQLAKNLSQPQTLVGSLDVPDCEKFQSEQASVNDDEVIASLLQAEFDKEYNEQVALEARKFNGNSKVQLSFDKYLYDRFQEVYDESEDEEKYPDDDGLKRNHQPIDSFEKRERDDPLQLGRCGYARSQKSGQIRTKHDSVIAQRKNAKKVMEFPPGMRTGDGGGFDMNLSNRVYNQLKMHACSDTYRRQRVKDKEEISTSVQALDKATRLTIYKLINRGILDEVNGVIATGKESVVLHATGADEPEIPMGKELVIKAYKTTLDDYKTRGKYLRDDHRYQDCLARLNPRTLIASWAQKELQNLRRLKNSEIPCPEPYFLKKHVLIMSLIGKKGTPAQKLKDVVLTSAQWEIAYDQVVQLMKKMYQSAELVHCDLSEYNILFHQGQCYFIDVSQAILKNSPSALVYLYRDCRNICSFFKKRDVHEVMSPAELLKEVSGMGELNPKSLDFELQIKDYEQQIRDYEKNEENLAFQVSEQDDPFEMLWDLTHQDENESEEESEEE